MNPKKRKKVLVYPCGTEIGLEIHKAVNYSTYFELWGGSSNYDHGRFVYEKHLDNLPFITDNSEKDEIVLFCDAIEEFQFDYIYPAMDGVLFAFSKYASDFSAKIIVPDFFTAKTTRSKKETYILFKDLLLTPYIFDDVQSISNYPIFIKPNVGQGSRGAKRIDNKKQLEAIPLDGMLLLEYIPGEEYTVDCFTNGSGSLIYSQPRIRKRVKNGISVSSAIFDDSNNEFKKLAQIINNRLNQRGGWFFQVKRNNENKLVLLEIASRIAGASSFSRCRGVNLPLLTLYLFDGNFIDSVLENKYSIVLDRALSNSYALNISYDTVYIDYDDIIIVDTMINIEVITFLYQCINNKKRIILLTKHDGEIESELVKYKIKEIFDEVLHIKNDENKSNFINETNSVFIDDSFGERKAVYRKKGIPVFDTHMIECLIN